MRWLLVVVVLARVAAAQSPDFAKEFQAGVDAFRLGHFDEARTHLEAARTLDPKLPGPHRFLAAVARAQERWQDCIDLARAALERNPQSQEAPDTRKLHDECRASAGRAPYRGPELGDSAAISVTTSVPGATVKINGLTYGGTPLAPRPITAGTLEVELAKAGWKPAHQSIAALPGIVTDVIIELEPDPNAKGNEVAVKPFEKPTTGHLVIRNVELVKARDSLLVDGHALDKPSLDIELAPGTHTIAIEGPHDPWRRRVRIAAGQTTSIRPELVDTALREHREHRGFALVAGGGALLLGGFVAALISEHAAADARDIMRVEAARDPTLPISPLEPLRTRADFENARSRASTWGVVSDLTIGAALVTAGIGAYYLYLGGRERTDVEPPFAVSPTTGGAVVSKEVAW